MSSDTAPKSSESEATVYKISSNPKETASRASGLGAKQPQENWTGEFAQAMEGEKVKTSHSPWPRASPPNSRPRLHGGRRTPEQRGGEERQILCQKLRV